MCPKTTFENVAFDKDDDTGSLVIFCRDREVPKYERWVVAALSEEDVSLLYKYLQQNFTIKEEP